MNAEPCGVDRDTHSLSKKTPDLFTSGESLRDIREANTINTGLQSL